MHISRTNGFVWIKRVSDRPWLITPEQPEVFVRTLSSQITDVQGDAASG